MSCLLSPEAPEMQGRHLAQAPVQVLCPSPHKTPCAGFVALSKKKNLQGQDFPFHLALTSAGLDLVALKKKLFPSY